MFILCNILEELPFITTSWALQGSLVYAPTVFFDVGFNFFKKYPTISSDAGGREDRTDMACNNGLSFFINIPDNA